MHYQEAKEGARCELLIVDSKGNPIESSANLIGNTVGMLDLTETIVQSLVLDIPNITFTVCESRKSALERQSIADTQPLAQSTAMDEEYGVTTKPQVIVIVYLFTIIIYHYLSSLISLFIIIHFYYYYY